MYFVKTFVSYGTEWSFATQSGMRGVGAGKEGSRACKFAPVLLTWILPRAVAATAGAIIEIDGALIFAIGMTMWHM